MDILESPQHAQKAPANLLRSHPARRGSTWASSASHEPAAASRRAPPPHGPATPTDEIDSLTARSKHSGKMGGTHYDTHGEKVCFGTERERRERKKKNMRPHEPAKPTEPTRRNTPGKRKHTMIYWRVFVPARSGESDKKKSMHTYIGVYTYIYTYGRTEQTAGGGGTGQGLIYNKGEKRRPHAKRNQIRSEDAT